MIRALCATGNEAELGGTGAGVGAGGSHVTKALLYWEWNYVLLVFFRFTPFWYG